LLKTDNYSYTNNAPTDDDEIPKLYHRNGVQLRFLCRKWTGGALGMSSRGSAIIQMEP